MQETFSDLEHLSEKEIEELIERYYNQERIKDLLEAYRLNIASGQLIRLFPPRVSDNICPYCNENMVKRFASRAYNNYDDGDVICEACKHIHDSFGCRCHNCRNAERERVIKEREEKHQAIKVILDKMNERRISSEELTLEEKIYLGALFRVGLSEDLSIINPVNSFYIPLAPTDNYSTEILENLSSRNIIGISPESDVDAFDEVDFANNSFTYTTHGIKRTLLIDVNEGDKKSFFESLMNPTYELLPEDAYDLWLKIALNECLEYFYYSVRNVFGAEYNAGNKTLSVFTEMLKNLSVSQVFCLIYRATNTALRFQVERGVYRKYAVNTIIGNAQNFAERALNNNWSTTKYSRPRECPQSALSKFFFDRVIKIGDDGFNMPPMCPSSPLDELNDQMPNF